MRAYIALFETRVGGAGDREVSGARNLSRKKVKNFWWKLAGGARRRVPWRGVQRRRGGGMPGILARVCYDAGVGG